jgi:hypothetical protein
MLSAGELEDEGWGAPSTPRTPYTPGGEYSVPPSPAPPTPYSPAYQSPGMEQDYFSVPSPVPPGREREQQQQAGPKLTLKLAPPSQNARKWPHVELDCPEVYGVSDTPHFLKVCYDVTSVTL